MRTSGSSIDRGARVDLGDLRLERGCVVSGVVRERAGAPAQKVALRAMPAGEWAKEPNCASALTGEDGKFTFDAALAPGRWVVRADPREFATSALFTVGVAAGCNSSSCSQHNESRAELPAWS